MLARHWIDLDRIQFGVYRDVLRLSGELYHTTQYALEGSASILEVLYSEFMRVPEIRCVAFDLGNWERDEDGVWQALGSASPTAVVEDDEPMRVFEMGESGQKEGK